MSGQTISTLKFMITADASGLVDGVVLTKKELREAGKVVDGLQSPFAQHKSRLDELGRLHAGGALTGQQFAQSIAKQRMEFASSLPIIGQFSGLLNPITAATTLATVGIGAMTAGVAGLSAVVASRIDDIDRLGDSAARLGINASSMSRIEVASMLGDVDPAGVEKFVTKLVTAVGKEDEAFAKIGLDVNKLKDLRADEMIGAIADKINKMPRLADRMAFLGEIGIKDKEILGLLSRFDELTAAADRSGAVVGDELAARVGEADDALKSLRASLTGMANDLTFVAAPAVSLVAGSLSELASRGDSLKQLGESIGVMFGGPASGIAGSVLGAVLDSTREANRQMDHNRQPIRSQSAIDAEAQIAATKEIVELEQDLERADLKKREAGERTIEQLNLQRSLLGKTAEEAARLKAIHDGLQSDQVDAIGNAAKLLDLEQKRLETARDYSRQAIKDIDAGEAIRRAGLTPKELAQERVDEAKRLMDAGVLDYADFVKESERAAASVAGRGGYGAPAVQQGTAAAREAVIMAGKQDEQIKLQREMAKNMRKIAEKKAVALEVVSDR